MLIFPQRSIIRSNKYLKRLIIAVTVLAAALAAIYAAFSFRPPILVITEQNFIALYGEHRINREAFFTSLAFFRPVKKVDIASDAGEDIVPHAIVEVSNNPYCVVFPLRFANSAAAYHGNNPEVPVIILEGRHQYRRANPGFFIYKTDVESDFYRAGLIAAIITAETEGRIAVFVDNRQFSAYRDVSRTAFSRGITEQGGRAQSVSFFASLSEMPENTEFACVVLAGTASDYLDRKADIPVIMFSWLDTTVLPMDVFLVVDDSPWAQLKEAVTLFSKGEEQGVISSKMSIFNRNFDRRILQKVRQIR